MFVVDGDFLPPFLRPVVVVGAQGFQVGLEGAVVDPPVEIEDGGLQPVDQLAGAYQPVLQPLNACAGGVDVRGGEMQHAAVELRAVDGGTVEIGVPLVVHVAVEGAAHVQEEIVLRPVGGGAEGQPLLFAGGF